MSEVIAGGLRFHVQRLAPKGDPAVAPTVVFVHGLALDDLSSYYFTLASPVSAAGAEVVLYDLRGQGLSEQPATGYALTDAVDDLFAVLDALGIDHPVYLVGNSFGGILAGNAALARPERVAGLVLIESSFAGEFIDIWLERMVNSMTAAALNHEHDRPHEHMAALGFRKTARSGLRAHKLLNRTSLIEDLAATPALDAALLEQVACPVLAVFGEKSEMVDAAVELVRHQPDCELAMLPGVAHTVLQDATEEVCGVVVDWLRRTHGAGAR